MTLTLLSVVLVLSAGITVRRIPRFSPFMPLWLFLGYLALTLWASQIQADQASKPTRNTAVRRAFLKSLGLTHTPKGCQVDHIHPLHCGGPDILENLQLLCGEALKQKERAERQCRPGSLPDC